MRNFRHKVFIIFQIFLFVMDICIAQLNYPPDFISDGDMSWLAIKEDLPIGSSIYTLAATDPEGSNIFYNISSNYFAVDKTSGVVTLIKSLNREEQDSIEVIISATDESVANNSAQTIELIRKITILDVNDNAPTFSNSHHIYSVKENTPIGTIINEGFFVNDLDTGLNAELSFQCFSPVSTSACENFEIFANQQSPGRYLGLIRLKKSLDYEISKVHILTIRVEDGLPKHWQSTNMIVEVVDIQDQPPIFENSPYFWKLDNLTTNKIIQVFDGDRGRPNPLHIELIEPKGYFDYTIISDSELRYDIELTLTNLYFEHKIVNNFDEFYEFIIRATEIENGTLTATHSETSVTILFESIAIAPKWSNSECNLQIVKTSLHYAFFNECHLYVSGSERYSIMLAENNNYDDLFEFEPKAAKGLTKVQIYLKNDTDLDIFGDQPYLLQLVAFNDHGLKSSTNISINLVNATDKYNIIQFEHEQYTVNVSENSPPGTFIAEITVNSNQTEFQKFNYSIQGFGSNWFKVDSEKGQIVLADCGTLSCLDFEKFSQFFLVYIVSGSFNNRAVTNLTIQVTDENDNFPMFVNQDLVYSLPVNGKNFDFPIKLQAIDVDSHSNISYKIIKTTPTCDAFVINSFGELSLESNKIQETFYDAAQYVIQVTAEDMGTPPLSSDAYVVINIKKDSEDKMVFTQQLYNVTILETDVEGKEILHVAVIDSAGSNNTKRYRIKSGAMDNFNIDSNTGVIKIATNSELDLDKAPDYYNLELEVVTGSINGSSLQTSSANVEITVKDVNNKSPIFLKEYYIQNVDDDLKIGDSITTVKAIDTDVDSFVHYFINEIAFALDENGLLLSKETLNCLKNTYDIHSLNGTLFLKSEIDSSLFSTVCLIVGAQDLNAVGDEVQADLIKVFLLNKRKLDFNPKFLLPWTPAFSQIYYSIPEEASIGSQPFTLTAKSLHGESNITFEKLNDDGDYLTIDNISGIATIKKRLDFEALPIGGKSISFIVKATNTYQDRQYSSTATVIVDIIDINDNSPFFMNETYWKTLPESSTYPDIVMNVSAIDRDQQFGFGSIRYFLAGDTFNDAFEIDILTGNIIVAKEKHLDREKKAIYNLKATAVDNPDGIENHRQSSVLIVIELEDVNDNFPIFAEPLYQAVFPETVAPGFIIRHIIAKDADLHENGRIRYTIGDSANLQDHIAINEDSGILILTKALSGKGQSEPYKIVITASDYGSPPLSSNVSVLLFITDISPNDGVPSIMRPLNGEVVYLQENAPAGTKVTKLEVSDSDIEKLDNGLLRFSFLGDAGPESDEKLFAIDPLHGIVTSRYPLDREVQVNYTITIIVKYFENPANHICLSLIVNIIDVDDHFPRFPRLKNSHPIVMKIDEEVPINTVVGYINAVDEDDEENSAIEYFIIENSKKNSVFAIKRTIDNSGLIYVNKRIDCESTTSYILTVQAKRFNSEYRKGKYFPTNIYSDWLYEDIVKEKSNSSISYEPSSLDLVQVKINIQDIDDHDPYFIHGNTTIYIKSSLKPGDIVFKFTAVDDDVTKSPITYKIINAQSLNMDLVESNTIFKLEELTGILRLWKSLASLANGNFEIDVEAKSNNKTTTCKIIIYVIQTQQMVKFVFKKPVIELKNNLIEFKQALQENLDAEKLAFVNLETSFINEKAINGNLTSICFPFLNEDKESKTSEIESLINVFSEKLSLESLYDKFGVEKIEKCENIGTMYTMNWIDISILVIATLIVIITAICCFILCFSYNRHR